jgi:hypothetical protein
VNRNEVAIAAERLDFLQASFYNAGFCGRQFFQLQESSKELDQILAEKPRFRRNEGIIAEGGGS